MSFSPRRGSHMILQDGRYYYRRIIPARYRAHFGGKTTWKVALKSIGRAALEAEAAALAHVHNRQLAFLAEVNPEALQAEAQDAVAMFIDLAPANPPPGFTPPPAKVFVREGREVAAHRFVITDDPGAKRKAEAAGFFVMSQAEALAQFDHASHIEAAEIAATSDQREIADLKRERAARHIADAEKVSAETVLSILPAWKAFKKQTPMTWQKHEQYVKEFAGLHGDINLSNVRKSHVVEYVEYAMNLTHRGEPLSPTSIQKRLDSVRALLAFATSRDLIEVNPATGVQPPKDTRPKTARSWKSFTPAEIVNLVEVSTAIWAGRKERTAKGRRADLMTALQCLIWTGARPEEICQLRREDIDLTGRKSIKITNDEIDDKARARVTKNDHSIREVPIHPRLLSILAAHLKSHNQPLAFPSFAPQPRPKELREAARTGKPVEMKGRYMFPLSREWTDRLRQKVAGGDPRKVLYSLRHSWAAESRRAGMPEHVRNALMGHADDNPHAGRYGGDADWLEEKRRHLEVMNCYTA